MKRVAIYARYSSDNQKEASIEDQVRECRERAEREGWSIINVYTDYAISGASMNRAGIRQLLKDLEGGQFDLVFSEALDRISRDQGDIAHFHRSASFHGVAIHTLSEGAIDILHIGLKGTMNALYIKDMKDKVKRGQRGRVESGFIGGGNCYGYDVVKRLDARGEKVAGERTINVEQAKVVERIFRNYAVGKSPKRIAAALNAEKIAGPAGRGWGPSTIYGNWQRGAGVLNNELYIGQIVWNKVSYPKNPDTGRHVTRNNPESEWVRKEVPELRIIDQELWDRAKARQKRTRSEHKGFWQHQRPRHLLSYRLKCGVCGGGMCKISSHRYGCSTARNKGDTLCSNHRTVRQDRLENTVLESLQKNLMDPKLVEVFCKEYRAHVNRLRMEHNASLAGNKAELKKLGRRQDQIVQAVMDGYASEKLKQESNTIDAREKELGRLIAGEREAPVLLHPNMADRYRKEVTGLISALSDEKHKEEAIGLLQSLVDKVVLTPDPNSDELLIDLYGDLAGILNVAIGKETGKEPQQEIDLRQIRMVVGLDNPRSTPRTGHRQGKLVGPAGLEPATRPL